MDTQLMERLFGTESPSYNVKVTVRSTVKSVNYNGYTIKYWPTSGGFVAECRELYLKEYATKKTRAISRIKTSINNLTR